jgi:hypothetical protein
MRSPSRRKRTLSNIQKDSFIEIQKDSFFKSDSEEEEQKSPPTKRQKAYSLMFLVFQYPILVCAIVLLIFNFVCYCLARVYVRFLENVMLFLSPLKKLRNKLAKAKTYSEWKDIAKLLDKKSGHDQWKIRPSTEQSFDEELLVKISNRLERYRSNRDLQKLCATLQNSACKNDLGGVESEVLYSRGFFGTKKTVDNYIHQVILALEYVYKSNMSQVDKISFFKQVSLTYGQTALCFSGGATLGYIHIGVMKALYEADLLPSILSGTSAGSLMGI